MAFSGSAYRGTLLTGELYSVKAVLQRRFRVKFVEVSLLSHGLGVVAFAPAGNGLNPRPYRGYEQGTGKELEDDSGLDQC